MITKHWRQQLTIPRRSGVTNRQIIVGYMARFYDELMSGLPDVLMPTIQAQFGLSLTQVALLRQVLDYVSVGIEPINGLLIDVWQRKWLMGFGAAMLGLAIITMGLAPTFALLVLGYVLFGLGSGPLAHTGDVVVIEAYPSAPDRAYARSTLIDTTGALLAPLLVTLFFWQGWPWRWLLIGVGLLGLVYAGVTLRTTLVAAHQNDDAAEEGLLHALRQNLREVLADQTARRWLLLLFLFDLMELPLILKTVWLAQVVGMSQTLIGIYVAVEMGVGIVSLLFLDFWRQQASAMRVLRIVTPVVALLFPLWLLTPGLWARFALMIPLNFFFAMFWPILKANSLASLPGKAGAVTAVRSLFGLIPLALLFGLLADQVGMTVAMLGVNSVAVLILWWMLRRD